LNVPEPPTLIAFVSALTLGSAVETVPSPFLPRLSVPLTNIPVDFPELSISPCNKSTTAEPAIVISALSVVISSIVAVVLPPIVIVLVLNILEIICKLVFPSVFNNPPAFGLTDSTVLFSNVKFELSLERIISYSQPLTLFVFYSVFSIVITFLLSIYPNNLLLESPL
jgi:hypothetical protein